MDLTSNDLYYLIKKKIKDKIDKNKKPTLPSISIAKRLELLRLQKKEENYEKYFKGIILNESNISNFIYNSVNPKINNCFNNLEYLSLTNNFLINLNFIVNIPELFYLDVFGNPLDDFSSLNYKNIFGYLRLSVDKFHENKILAVTGLNCAILDIEIKDKTILKLFKTFNKNILIFNNEINYYVDELENRKRKTYKSKKSLLFYQGLGNNINIGNKNNEKNKNLKMNFNENIQHIEQKGNDSKNNSDNSENSFYDLNKNNNFNLNNIKVEIKNEFLLEIKNFFEELKQVLTTISKKIKTTITVSYLYTDDTYLEIEKKRILLLYRTYLKLSSFNKEKNSDYFFCKNIISINSNKFTDSIILYEIKKFIKCININIRFGIIILIAMLFYCLNLISMKLSISIIHYILIKCYKFDEHKQIPKINSFGDFHYLCYYIDNLEDFKKKLIFAEKSQIDLYQKILDILEIKNLILKSNVLKHKKEEYENKNKHLFDDISQKNKVSTLLLLMKELKIDQDILILIEFFCDFIKYENMEQIVINEALKDEYSTLIEIKEILELFELDKNNLSIKDLSNKKYYKNKLERIFNKFYFENNKIKVIKNKNFRSIKSNKLSSTKFNLLSFIINWNKDYMKTDQINIKNCFIIDKLKKKDNNKNIFTDSKEHDYIQNICFSEDKKNIKNPSKISHPNFHSIISEKNNSITSIKNSNFKDENNKSKSIYYKTNYNNKSNFTINSDKSNNNIFEIKPINDDFHNKNSFYNINKDSKNNNFNIFNSKTITFRELFKYFDKSSKNNKIKLKNIYNKRLLKKHLLITNNDKKDNNIKVLKNNKTDKYYITLNNNKFNEGCFPFNTLNKEDAKLKIKQIDNDIVNINAHRLYWKKTYNNNRENIQIYKENFSDGLLVEKFNQTKQEKIINTIIENKNRKIKELLMKTKKLNEKNI